MRTTVSEWNEKLEDGGARGAEAPATGSTGWARFHAGRELIQQLRQGALAAGFGTELWTLPRVFAAAVLSITTGNQPFWPSSLGIADARIFN